MKPSASEELSENIEVVTPGDMLREARLALQFTPEEVCAKLNLRESLIDAIEANEFDEIPSVTFTRGYLKAYAKLVGISEDDVIEAFEYLNTVEQNQLEMQSFSNRSSKKAADNWLSIVSMLVALLLIALAVMFWWQRNEALEAEQTPTVQEEVKPAEQQDKPIVDEQAAELTDASSDFTGSSLVEQSDEAIDQEAPSSVQADNENNVQEVQASETQPVLSQLELRFSDSCWINISDATGERIAIGTKVKGHVTAVQGVAPFTIKLGKPDVVTIYLNGNEKKIPYYAKGSVANFVLSDD